MLQHPNPLFWFTCFGNDNQQGLPHACDLAAFVTVDGQRAGRFGQAGHEYHGPGDDDQKASVGREYYIGNVQRPAGGNIRVPTLSQQDHAVPRATNWTTPSGAPWRSPSSIWGGSGRRF